MGQPTCLEVRTKRNVEKALDNRVVGSAIPAHTKTSPFIVVCAPRNRKMTIRVENAGVWKLRVMNLTGCWHISLQCRGFAPSFRQRLPLFLRGFRGFALRFAQANEAVELRVGLARARVFEELGFLRLGVGAGSATG
jgi:hypothetical protein